MILKYSFEIGLPFYVRGNKPQQQQQNHLISFNEFYYNIALKNAV